MARLPALVTFRRVSCRVHLSLPSNYHLHHKIGGIALANLHVDSDLCREFGVSRQTGYRWINRYKEAGPEGLQNCSSKPNGCSMPHLWRSRTRSHRCERTIETADHRKGHAGVTGQVLSETQTSGRYALVATLHLLQLGVFLPEPVDTGL
jgi:hypothetical protein